MATKVPSHEVSASLLRQLVDGTPLADLAAAAGMTPSAAEQRIKRLAQQLQTLVGVENVPEQTNPTVRLLRDRRDDYLEALAHFDPSRAVHTLPVPSTDDLQRILDRIRTGRQHTERDLALILVLFCTGLRPSELLQLDVGDYLAADGMCRPVSTVRGQIAANGRERPLYFASSVMTKALDGYLARRAAACRTRAVEYRGLPADAPLLTWQMDAAQVRFTHTQMHNTLRRLVGLSGKPHMTSLSGRRFAANRLLSMGVSERDIARVLGLGGTAAVRALIVPSDVQTAMRRLV